MSGLVAKNHWSSSNAGLRTNTTGGCFADQGPWSVQVLGVSKQRAGRERWAVLSTLASALFEAQVARAATQPRFYVIDQSR